MPVLLKHFQRTGTGEALSDLFPKTGFILATVNEILSIGGKGVSVYAN
jgi:hypothetical protein